MSDADQTFDPELLAAQLEAIPALYARLGEYMLPGSAPLDPDARRGTSSPARPPAVLDVIDLLDTRLKPQADDESGERDVELDQRAGYRRLGILPTLGLWVSMVTVELADLGQETESCCPAGEHTVTGECAWLAAHLDQVLELHGGDFAADVDWMWRDLQRAVGESVRRPYQPRCPWCHDRVEGQGPTGVDWFHCLGCARTWRLDAEIRRLAATQPPMTLRQCADALKRPVKTLQRWRSELRFLPVGRRKDAELYDLEIVRRVAASVAPGRPGRVA